MSDDEPVIRIRIEADVEDDSRLAWVWTVNNETGTLCGGTAYSFDECLGAIQKYLDFWTMHESLDAQMRKANAAPDA